MYVLPDVKEAAHFLWKVLQNEEISQIFKAYEQVLFDLSVKLWDRRDTTKLPIKAATVAFFATVAGLIIITHFSFRLLRCPGPPIALSSTPLPPKYCPI